MSDLQRITERYRLDKLIHASDVASVFRATDSRSGQVVALKLIRAEIDESRHDGRAVFESAARALQDCSHPSLPCLLDFGFTAAGSAFLVTEYLLGARFELFAGSPARRVLPLLLPVLDGLEELDRHQLAHRNLRADNLLVMPRGDEEQVKLLGWGSAAVGGGEEGRRADLRAFAELACEAIGAEIEREPSIAVNLTGAARDEVADAAELAMLLSLLLQPGGAAPASLFPELRGAFRQALFGDAGPAPDGGRDAAGAPEVVDLDQTRAVLADVTIAVPRDRLLGAMDRLPAAAAARAGAILAEEATAKGTLANESPTGGTLAPSAAPAGGTLAADETAAVGEPQPAASTPSAGAPAALLRTDTLPEFRPADLSGTAAGTASSAAERLPPAPPAQLQPADASTKPSEAQPAVAPPYSMQVRAPAEPRVSLVPAPVVQAVAADPEFSSPPAFAAQARAPAGAQTPASARPAAAARQPQRARPRSLALLQSMARRRSSPAAGIALAGIAAMLAVAALVVLRHPAARSHPQPAAGRRPPAATAAAGTAGLNGATAATGATAAAAAARRPAAPAPIAIAAQAGAQPVLAPRLKEAREQLSSGDADGARRTLAQISMQEQAAFSPAEHADFDQLTAALAADRRSQIVADLAAGLRRGDIRRLNAALTAAKREPDLPAAVRRELARARQAVDLDTRLYQADKALSPQEVLRQATDLLALLPRYGRASDLRQQSAKALEDQADAALAAGDAERAAALVGALRQAWPDRPGLQDRTDRIESQRRADQRLEAVLASAGRAEAAGQPLQGLELLAGANPGGRFRDRFRQQRERLDELLARLDAAPPAISLRPGFKLEYDKGARIVVPLRITDDLAVKSAECWVRAEGDASFRAVPVRHLSGADYEIDIPPELHQNRTLELYATASDNSGHQSLLGSRDNPLKLKRRTWLEKVFRKEGT
jgi:hypothetical protein